MPEPDAWNALLTHIQALADSILPSKTGKIRQLLPHIEASVHAGITLKRISEELNKAGIQITYHDFRELLSRVRRQARKERPSPKAAATSGSFSAATASSAQTQKPIKFVHNPKAPDLSELH